MLHGRALKVEVCVVVLGLLAWSSQAVRAAEKDDVMKALQGLQKEVKSYTANGQSKITFGDRSFEQTLAVVAKEPGMYKETMTAEWNGNEVERTTVCDGKTLWLPAGRGGQISSIDLAAVAKALGIGDAKSMYMPREPIDLANPLIALNAKTIKYDGKEAMGDMDVYVFEGQSQWPARQRRDQEAEPYWPKMKLMISAEDGLLRSATTYNRDGEELRVVTYTDVKVNPAVEDAVFALEPAEMSAAEDATQATIDQMKEAMEAAKKAEEAAAQ